ncbi:hypothetical protein HMPREF0731_2288 [Pseudoroseomonas cervicalis ATCC 49957]|uniref:Uncharacterized protein n=1 Tax=Pseudoroseomonas cervicalis ATCC 49957 TaxID=525371 RepID=D5RMH7_9PROT|nr:hypothetical protein HMPREF0731_2288 [Pseudoroseomonas cervicalis ATCC 49957]
MGRADAAPPFLKGTAPLRWQQTGRGLPEACFSPPATAAGSAPLHHETAAA